MTTMPAAVLPVIWTPNPGAQTRLITCPCNEILYGGAKGGGKSDGILGFWLAHVARNPQFARGIIFRKSFPELEQLIQRSIELFMPLGARYNENKKTWLFKDGGRLKFRFVDRAAQAKKYQGHEYTWIAFDEVGEIGDVEIINALRGALRSAKEVKDRVLLLCGNPLGDGHPWLKARFIDAAGPETPIIESMDVPAIGGIPPQTVTWSRVFIPATIEENPKLLAADPGYLLRLEQMCAGKPGLYRALRYGDWSATLEIEGALWNGEEIENHRIDRSSMPLLQLTHIWVGVDPSGSGNPGSDECGIVVAAGDTEGHQYTLEDASCRAKPEIWAPTAVRMARKWGALGIAAEKNFGGEMVRTTIERYIDKDETIQVKLINSSKGKEVRAEPVAMQSFRGKIHNIGRFHKLEQEQTTFVPHIGKKSPNRMDAYVFAHVAVGDGGLFRLRDL